MLAVLILILGLELVNALLITSLIKTHFDDKKCSIKFNTFAPCKLQKIYDLFRPITTKMSFNSEFYCTTCKRHVYKW